MLPELKNRYGKKSTLVAVYLILIGLSALSGSILFLVSSILENYTLTKVASSLLGVYLMATFIEGKFVKSNSNQTFFYKKLLKPTLFLSLCFLVIAIIIFLIT